MSTKINPIEVRKFYPGFVGGDEITRKATDEEIVWLVKQQNKAGKLANQADKIQKQIKNMQTAIKGRYNQNE